MTLKQKAEQLVINMYYTDIETMNMHCAKQCALIAVNELIKEQTMWQNGEVNPVLYWQEVKIEIEKL
jgi:hypothetical protein